MVELDELDEENPSLLAIAKSFNTKDDKLSSDRTKLGAKRSALAMGSSKRLMVGDLVSNKNLETFDDRQKLKKMTNRILKKANKFDTPLAKIEREKADRKLHYEQTTLRIDKNWDSLAKRHRFSEHVDLRSDNKKLQLVPTEAKKAPIGTELERELEAVLKGSIYTHGEGDELSKAEQRALESLSIEEAKLRRIELQKHRHLQSTYQQKARRQKKIKSRTFHRHLKKREKKEAEKSESKTEEELELQKAKERIDERATLKHASTGSKWSQSNKRLRFKDDSMLKDINAQIQVRNKRTTRVEFDDQEKEDDLPIEDEQPQTTTSAVDVLKDLEHNEWLTGEGDTEQVEKNIEEVIELGGKKKIENSGVMKLPEIITEQKEDVNDTEDTMTEMEKELQTALEFKQNRIQTLELDSDNSEEEIDGSTIQDFTSRLAKRQRELKESINEEEKIDDIKEDEKEEQLIKKPSEMIDINDVMKKSRIVGQSDAQIIDIEDANGESTTIREAFEDDDVISEFKKGKLQKIHDEKPKVIDLILPGFDGEWAGEDYKPSKKLKRRFRLQQKSAPRKDTQLGHVIISENNKSLEAMRIDRLPFPYQNLKQMEKVISQPIGATWNSASAVRELTKPSVIINSGEIIEPVTLHKEPRFSDIFPVEVGAEEESKKKAKRKISGKHKDNKERVFEKKRKGGRRITAADGTSLSNM